MTPVTYLPDLKPNTNVLSICIKTKDSLKFHCCHLSSCLLFSASNHKKYKQFYFVTSPTTRKVYFYLHHLHWNHNNQCKAPYGGIIELFFKLYYVHGTSVNSAIIAINYSHQKFDNPEQWPGFQISTTLSNVNFASLHRDSASAQTFNS